ncbi:unnamed protein product [Acanthoscelides obtectus]|uniref:Uncharacterized protein n=2 Tax=Acanthoscelides obtectus TaxID=200917 RepID=A0A9P0LT59_ACAOB|nr:unnamed protein product [Acanthoscelides obtectus]CAH2011506.1 unnamed protein product [Acanthoscelides obtectus]CAH2016297.1 unnamed protein product [Acanthoscelides obtectus]CAK1630357.1 hypothetical protein AOBTE_LOCUS6280 [Acanthoscelides obtectus]CAK1630379.1 hypothetical protein AOBTE_LOCUS6288 [Acanthoscelides obtectus]
MRLNKMGSYHTEKILYSQQVLHLKIYSIQYQILLKKMIWIGRNSLDFAQMAHLQ